MIKRACIFVIAIIFFACHAAAAADLSAKATVEKTEVYLGEPFIFQVLVSGSENPQQPDTSVIKDFNVVFQGGQQNSSSSITIINGKVTKDVREGYYFSYQLTPTREGHFTIPSIKVIDGSSSAETDPIQISVGQPTETEDFKLRLSLSSVRCYIGEPVILTAKWYIGKDVRDFSFTLPVLSDDAFKYADMDAASQQSANTLRIPIGNSEVTGVKGKGTLDGRDFTTVTFKKVLIPVRSGNITIAPATVSCNAIVGYQRQRDSFNDRFFDNFFNDDFFNSVRTSVYDTVVVPSNSLSLKVLDVPETGMPSDFAGHIGSYAISASAAPVDVSAGDPITLTLKLSGPEYLENVDMPALEKQPALKRSFKIPSESARGEVSGKTLVFAQTIRPLRAGIKEIPAIELPYFDPDTQTYQIARTEPIPLTVRETKLVTALDAEGNSGDVAKAGSGVESLNKGIASNYEDMTVIEELSGDSMSSLRSPLMKVLVFGPPLLYLLLLTGVYYYRHRNGDSIKVRSRKAYSRLSSALKAGGQAASMSDGCTMVLDAFRNYLGNKLHMTGNALTFNDVKDRLSAGGLDQATMGELEAIFRKCEEGRYAGNAGTGDVAPLIQKALMLAKEIEKRIK
jgi:BatD DUF11 like domain